jgi:hypothetical protein
LVEDLPGSVNTNSTLMATSKVPNRVLSGRQHGNACRFRWKTQVEPGERRD